MVGVAKAFNFLRAAHEPSHPYRLFCITLKKQPLLMVEDRLLFERYTGFMQRESLAPGIWLTVFFIQ
jgi:hypothetical protein